MSAEPDNWDAAKLRQQVGRLQERLAVADTTIAEFSARIALLSPLLDRALQLQYGPEDWRGELAAAIATQSDLAEHVHDLEQLLAEGQNIVRPLVCGDRGVWRWLERAQAVLRDPVGHARRFRIYDVEGDQAYSRITTLQGKHVATVHRDQLREKLLELMEAP